MFNRTWAATKRESLAAGAEGVARPEDADGAFEENRCAPVGLDVALDENQHTAEFPHLPARARNLLHACVDVGKVGVETGVGCYTYRTRMSAVTAPVNRIRSAGATATSQWRLPALHPGPSAAPRRQPPCAAAGAARMVRRHRPRNP